MKYKIILIILLVLIFGCNKPIEEPTAKVILEPELFLIDKLTMKVLKINSFVMFY